MSFRIILKKKRTRTAAEAGGEGTCATRLTETRAARERIKQNRPTTRAQAEVEKTRRRRAREREKVWHARRRRWRELRTRLKRWIS